MRNLKDRYALFD
jgi:hypothetical protein